MCEMRLWRVSERSEHILALFSPSFLAYPPHFLCLKTWWKLFWCSSLLNEAQLGFLNPAICDRFEPFGRCKSVLHTRAFVFFLAKVYCIVNMSIRRAIKRLLDSVEF